MTTYVIGDLHGCLDELQLLLEKISFSSNTDHLWFTGDLINGTPKAVETLYFLKSLGSKATCILGNHDLTLIALAHGINCRADKSGYDLILNHPNKIELIDWLQHLSLSYYNPTYKTLMVHAGVPPQWDLKTTLSLSKEVEAILHGPNSTEFLQHMYGDQPDLWRDDLKGWDKYRFVINSLTRMRFCTVNGKLEFQTKGPIGTQPEGFIPWFDAPNRKAENVKIIFGHWASLLGKTNNEMVIAMDTGCLWGHHLTALNLDTGEKTAVDSLQPQ